MRRLALAAIVLLAMFTGPALAAPGNCTNAPSLVAFAFEEISVSSTAIGFTAATAFPDGRKGADMAVVTIEDDAIRYRDDGLAPTATVGHPAAVNTSLTVCGAASLKRFLAIRQTTDADINVTYYRMGDQ